MHLKELCIEGFKSFGKQATLTFPSRITSIVGPNGSGKSNVAEAFRFVLGEQSMKSMRGKRGEDLIFNGGTGASRANRASVSIVFDNRNRLLNSAFNEVSISRTVYRNGTNEYTVNNTQVRHRDIIELLAGANIGSTGHHIISQGEADRILHASNEERKEMLEDGLGLKLLQYRRAETEKRLKHAQTNIAETELILRETAPHLRYLKRQVTRYEKAKKVRGNLKVLYKTYLAYEVHYIATTKCALESDFDTLQEKIKNTEREIEQERKKTATVTKIGEERKKEEELNKNIRNLRTEKEIISRNIGRIEGERNALEEATKKNEKTLIERKTVTNLYKEIQERHAKTTEISYPTLISYIIEQLQTILNSTETPTEQSTKNRLDELEKEQEKTREKISTLKKREEEYLCVLETLRTNREKEVANIRQSEKKLLALITEKNNLDQNMSKNKYESNLLKEAEEELRRELSEGAVLIGNAVNEYKEVIISPDIENEDRTKQKERRRILERKKIELESMDTEGSNEVYREYGEVSERVDFLNREKKDLLESIHECEKGVEEIQKEVSSRFKTGVQKISEEFERLFKILFGGGSAEISVEKNIVTKEDEEPETRIGVAIQVSLPHKKITGMEQLSGGERALVSIALLFAISQITPPPFLILDETDAALDEANSRRYGDMIESLAKKSQLIMITHNRETMYRAGALYGVTMSTAGASSLLSVQFEDAVQVTK